MAHTENVYFLDKYRTDKAEAMRRHPCNAQPPKPRLRLTKRAHNLIACLAVLGFIAAMGYIGYVEGL